MDPNCVELHGKIHVYYYAMDDWFVGTVVCIPCPGFCCKVVFDDGDQVDLFFQSAIWGVDGKPLCSGSSNPPLSDSRSTVAEAITKWETAPSGSHDSTRL